MIYYIKHSSFRYSNLNFMYLLYQPTKEFKVICNQNISPKSKIQLIQKNLSQLIFNIPKLQQENDIVKLALDCQFTIKYSNDH